MKGNLIHLGHQFNGDIMTNKYLKFGIQNEDMQLVTEDLQKLLNNIHYYLSLME